MILWELEFAKQITSFWASHPAMNFITYFLAILTTIFEYGIGGIILGLVLCFPKKTRRVGFMTLFTMLIFALLVNNVICKHLIARLRPIWEDTSGVINNNATTIFLPLESRWLNLDFWAVPKKTSYSFMSGHTVAVFLVATLIFKHYKKLGLLSFGIATIVGFSRIYFGFHYVSDVVTGAVYGIAAGLIAYYLYNKIEELLLNFIKKRKQNN